MTRIPIAWREETAGGDIRLHLSGEITEETDFGPLLGAVAGRSPLSLDMAGIRRINSAGVREWVRFVDALRGSGCHFSLERCSVASVHQLNMVAPFGGGAEVHSVLAPYLCETCFTEKTTLLQLDPQRPVDLGRVYCPTCGNAMQFDDIPESYFSFHARGCLIPK